MTIAKAAKSVMSYLVAAIDRTSSSGSFLLQSSNHALRKTYPKTCYYRTYPTSTAGSAIINRGDDDDVRGDVRGDDDDDVRGDDDDDVGVGVT